VRNLLKEILRTSRLEKLSLILPFIVAIIDAEIFYYSFTRGEKIIIVTSAFVLFLSILEIITVLKEINLYVERVRKREEIEEKIMLIAKKIDNPTVKKVMEKYMDEYDDTNPQEVYPIVCRVVNLLKK